MKQKPVFSRASLSNNLLCWRSLVLLKTRWALASSAEKALVMLWAVDSVSLLAYPPALWVSQILSLRNLIDTSWATLRVSLMGTSCRTWKSLFQYRTLRENLVDLFFFTFSSSIWDKLFQCHYYWTPPTEFGFLPCKIIKTNKWNFWAGFYSTGFFFPFRWKSEDKCRRRRGLLHNNS